MSGIPRGVIPPGPRKRSAAGRDSRLRSGFSAWWRLVPYRANMLTGAGMSGFSCGVIPPGTRKCSAAGRDSRLRS
uniref:hypothetical protein n=1 Tax=Klebsiella variicola TaxID=244366 RepID=UPI0034D22EB2